MMRIRHILRRAVLTKTDVAHITALLARSAAHVPILRLIVDSRHAMDAGLLSQFAPYNRDYPDSMRGDTALHTMLRAFFCTFSVLLDYEAAYDTALAATMRACATIVSAENVNVYNVDGESPLQVLCAGMSNGAVRTLAHMRAMERLVYRMLAVGATCSMRRMPEATMRRLSYVPAVNRKCCGGCMTMGASVRSCGRCSATRAHLRHVRRVVSAVSESDIRDERVRAMGQLNSDRLTAYLEDPASDPHLVGLALDSDALAAFLAGDVVERIEAARSLAVWAYCAFASATRAYCSPECLATDAHMHVGRCMVLYRHAKAQHARFTSGRAATLLLDEGSRIEAALQKIFSLDAHPHALTA
jgi:hypothetical protein